MYRITHTFHYKETDGSTTEINFHHYTGDELSEIKLNSNDFFLEDLFDDAERIGEDIRGVIYITSINGNVTTNAINRFLAYKYGNSITLVIARISNDNADAIQILTQSGFNNVNDRCGLENSTPFICYNIYGKRLITAMHEIATSYTQKL